MRPRRPWWAAQWPGSPFASTPCFITSNGRSVARLSAATAATVGVGDGERVTVSTDAGAVTLPVLVTDMPDHVVWLPTNAADCAVRGTLHADAGDVVTLAAAGNADAHEDEEATA